MGDIKIDIPDITVVVSKGEEYLASVTPGEVYQVSVNTGDNYNVNLTRPQVVPITEDNYYRIADFATNALSASYAVTASYVSGAVTTTNWEDVLNKPFGLVSSSTQVDYTQLQNLPSASGTASYIEYVNVANKPTLVSSSTQIQLDQVSGTTFGSTNFTFPQDVIVGGILSADKLLVSSSIIYESGSTKFGDSIEDTHQFTGSVFVYGNVTADNFYGTASIAKNIGVIDAGFFETSSASYIIPIPSGGLSYVTSASYATTASHATSANINGIAGYIPKWNTSTQLNSSIIRQDQNSIIVGEQEPLETVQEKFVVNAGNTDSFNLLSGYGSINNYLQFNLKNRSSSNSGSADIVATADSGNETTGYVNMGINSSNYVVPAGIGGPLDAYLFAKSNDLLIGNVEPDKRVVIFAGSPRVTEEFDNSTKLVIQPNNQHQLTGSLNISSNVVAASFTGSLLATNGVVSSSAQISQSGFVSSTTINTIEVLTSASYAAITPVSGTLYVIVG